MPNILLISDDDFLKNDLKEQINLNVPDYNVFFNEDEKIHFDLIVTDENIPDKYHVQKGGVPIFLLTSQKENNYTDTLVRHIFTKPFKLADFLDELQAGIKRFENSRDGYLIFNNYELHPVSKEIVNLRNGEVIKLTEKEVAVIKYLYRAGKRIVSKNELLQEVWEYSPDVSTHTIETHVYRLRQKVEHDDPDAQLIMTEDGGYLLKTE